MDEVILKQLTRQLKLLNFWVSFFGILFLICFAVAGYFAYKAVTEVRKVESSLTSSQQSLEQNINLKNNLCNSSTGVSALIKKQTSVCN